jgi:hypothetical protein
MFRKFKRHYHVTKRAYAEAVEIGNLGFTISQAQGEPVKYSETAPEREKMSRLSALIYKFLDEKSELYYDKVLNQIKNDFPKVTTAEDFQGIEDSIKRIETGGFPLSINGTEYNSKQIFKIIAEAGYYERQENAQKFFQEIANIPFAPELFWHQFKSYTLGSFRIISVIFDLIQGIENHEEYKSVFASEEYKNKKCIYCLSETGDFNTEEHVFPESLAGDQIYLPKGYVCDKCNNGISSQLDNALINFEPIAVLRVQFTPYTKAGKLPRANFQNMVYEKTDPNHIKITAKDKTALPKNKKTLEDGQVAFNLTWKGKKLDWKLYARAIYKIAFGLIAHDLGHEAVFDAKYQPARDFILKGSSFNNNMMVSTKSKPSHNISSSYDPRFEGTQFVINIFGMIFKINLEELPKLYRYPELDEVLRLIEKDYVFEFISLK